MNKNEVIQNVTKYITDIANDSSLELVDVEFTKEGANYYLRIYIDKEGGVNISDCQHFSRAIEPVLDEKDPIGPPYMLEVSSPGLDRIIKKEEDFVRFKGRIVDVKLYQAIDKKKQIQATLVGKSNNILSLQDEEEKLIEIEETNVVSVRLAVLF
ncbi:MAG: ribosome maturation factor RimP [Epulopiscium sp. Nele67-Bin004]|nr:MAG: ribosome maturation factor RimP [Epulopiscium sp. Nele67-Bin004]